MSETQINLAETPDFDLGGLHVSPARRRVAINGSGRELEPRVAQVLVALASARPDVISRDRLIDQCWDGRIVGDDALNRCIVALRHLAKEFTPEPFEIETVPRVGYRLIEGASGERPARRRLTRPRNIFAVLMLLLLVGTGVWKSGVMNGAFEKPPASIAVLPFRNLSAGEPYFAQGVSEEILGQLAREPQFRVAGSSSSSGFGEHPDVGAAAKALNVDYVVEGSVRRQGDQVRVNADLLRVKDGVRLWSGSYDGTLNDILKIQSAIGQAVADGLRLKLVYAATGSKRPVNGEAYALYLSARGLVRSRDPDSGRDAVVLLKQAIRIDPGYAPAWSGLAEALLLNGESKEAEGLIAALPPAEYAARRALQIDPDLPGAHTVLSTLLGSDTPIAIAHRKRAAELAPTSGEAQMWGAAAHEASGEYAEAIRSEQRAHDLDPLWQIPVRTLLGIYSTMGDRRRAEAVTKEGFADDPDSQNFALARVAWLAGDFSEAARRWSLAAKDPTSRFASPALLSLQDTKYMLRLSKDLPSRGARPSVGQFRIGPRVWMAKAPAPADWQRNNRSFGAALVNNDENIIAAKLMLNEGRARELVATYDTPWGLLGIRRGQRLGVCYLQAASLVALALRRVGRVQEADGLLREADALINTVYARGQVPTWFDEDAAAIWTEQGKIPAAMAALGRARSRGWVHAGRSDLPELRDEPVFRPLRADPRFQAVLAGYDQYYARERRETARELHIPLG